MSIIQEALKKAEKESFGNPKKRKLNLSRSIIILFAAACIFLIFLNLFAKYKGENKPLPLSRAVKNDESIARVEKTDLDLPEKEAEIEQLKDDLTYAYTKPYPVLSGIMYSRNRPLAVINDIMVGEGEEIRGLKVISIEIDSVDVEYDGESISLKLAR